MESVPVFLRAPSQLRPAVSLRALRQSPSLRAGWELLRWYSTKKGQRELAHSVCHVGWNVECPFCGWRGRSFYPHSEPHVRPNCQCPRCYSKERHRLLYLYLRDRTDLFASTLRVLEVAPGPYSFRLSRRLPHVEYITLDIADPLARCRGDITALPFFDESFDLILCYHVLEHVSEDRLAIAELRRVIRPGGLAIVQVPVTGQVTMEDRSVTDPGERLHLFGQDDHVRSYGYDWTERLTQAGFRVARDNYASALPSATVRRFGLDAQELIYCCHPVCS